MFTRLQVTVATLLLVATAIHGQAPSTGRIAGTIRDETKSLLAGVTVELSGAAASRFAVTDENGRYAFDAISPATTYALTATLPGFMSQRKAGIAVGPDATVILDLTLPIACLAIAHFITAPPLDQLLTSDAVVHLRVNDEGIERKVTQSDTCYTGQDASATILDVVRTSRAEWRRGALIQLHAVNNKVRAGEEYLAFMNFNDSLERFTLDSVRFAPVTGGRVEWYSYEQLGFRDGTPVGTALQKLRETYQRYSTYRRYDSLEPTTVLEKLRYRTGWVAIGTVAFRQDDWREERPFEFVTTSSPDRPLPRRNDRIRLKQDNQAHILDFGWRGETLRHVSPTTRPHEGHVSDLTGARVSAGVAYLVADVQFEPLEDADARIVWVKLVAD